MFSKIKCRDNTVDINKVDESIYDYEDSYDAIRNCCFGFNLLIITMRVKVVRNNCCLATAELNISYDQEEEINDLKFNNATFRISDNRDGHIGFDDKESLIYLLSVYKKGDRYDCISAIKKLLTVYLRKPRYSMMSSIRNIEEVADNPQSTS